MCLFVSAGFGGVWGGGAPPAHHSLVCTVHLLSHHLLKHADLKKVYQNRRPRVLNRNLLVVRDPERR